MGTVKIEPIGGAELGRIEPVPTGVEAWRGLDGPPVPVVIAGTVWDSLVQAALETPDPVQTARVFRLFMRRGEPRFVVRCVEIESVSRSQRGILRWNEGGYPPLSAAERKGGNALIRGDIELAPHDAWWMGREQTDLRILLRREGDDRVEFGAWWARGGTSGLGSRHETDGELLPVRLLVTG
jgi:hypothetical protein